MAMAVRGHRGRGVAFVIGFCLLVLSAGDGEAWNPKDCPRFCECFSHYGLKWTECVGRRLYSIHTGVDGAVQALDLSDNVVATLADHELRDAGLTRLKLLNLSSNTINEIGLSAFVGLLDLRVLDLSRNHLYYILPDTFVGNSKLEVLELAGNTLNQNVPRLRSSSIASLGLGGCRISYLPPNTFDRLPRLRALDLTDNTMIQLEIGMLKSIPNLAILAIERNPWSCNNEMYEIQSMLKDMNVVFKKVCNEKKLPQKPRIPHKFEKMIALDAAPTASTGKSGRLLAKIKNRRKSSNGKTTTQLCAPRLVTTSKVGDYSGSGLEDVSAYWFVAIGFLLGSSLGTVATYLWLAKTITRSLTSLRRRTTRSGSSTIADQRVNLLDNLWRSSVEDTSRPTTGCPGTPPPPYRDVMLHARRYPRPHIGSVLFADDRAALNERQVHS